MEMDTSLLLNWEGWWNAWEKIWPKRNYLKWYDRLMKIAMEISIIMNFSSFSFFFIVFFILSAIFKIIIFIFANKWKNDQWKQSSTFLFWFLFLFFFEFNWILNFFHFFFWSNTAFGGWNERMINSWTIWFNYIWQ